MADYGHIPGGGRPYGDIFYVQTPALDRMTQQLYQEQKQREQLRQRQAAALDDEFAKNVAGIRDADVPELTKLYSDWKLSNQSAMKKREGVSPEEQLQLLRKKGDMYKKIAESKAGLAEEEDLRKGIQKDADNYDDNASTYLAVRRRTPLSQLDSAYKDEKGNPINLRDYNTYKYKGTDTDFQKILTTAAGTPKQVYQKEEPADKNNLQFKITPYLYGNTPAQFKESVLNSLAQHKAGRDAEAIISQVDPQVIKSVDQEFKAIPLERWKQMGVDNPQDLVIRNADSKAEKFATHHAQLYALNNLPKEGTPIFRDNKEALRKADLQKDIFLEGLKQKNRLGLIAEREQAKSLGQAANDVWIDNYIDKLTDEGNEPGKGQVKMTYMSKEGSEQVAPVITVDPVLAKALEKQKVQPSDIMILPDGRYKPIYYQYGSDGKRIEDKKGGFKVDAELSVPISRDQLKLSLGAKSVSPTQRTKEMLNNRAEAPKKKSYSYKGKTFTSEQIEKAAKQSNITVDEYINKYGIK